MTKVQLSLTSQEAYALNAYGDLFGYSLPKTIRFMISKTVEEFLKSSSVPIYKMSEETEKRGLKALKEHKSGRGIAVKDVDAFFNQL